MVKLTSWVLKQKQKNPQIMSAEVKSKTVNSNTEIENASIDFNMLHSLEESINTY